MRKNRFTSTFLAVLALVAGLSGLSLAQSMPLATQTFAFDGHNGSKPLDGNWLEDQKWRNVTVYLPDGYPNGGPYRVVYVLPGFLMYDMENTIDRLVQGPRQAHLQANFPAWANYTFDMDGIAKRVMADLGPFIMVEMNGLTGLGGSLYDCSPVFGDYRSLVRQLVDEIDSRYLTVAHKDGRVILGFSMGGYGAEAMAIEYPEVFGGLAMLDPFGNDHEAGAVGNSPGGIVFIYRNLMHPQPFSSDLPVHKPMKDSDFATIQGAVPVSPFNDQYFFSQAVWAISGTYTTNQSGPFFTESLLVDDNDRANSPVNFNNWNNWPPRDGSSRMLAGGGNLSRTIVYLGRGNQPPQAPADIPLHRSITDTGTLVTAMNTKAVTYQLDTITGQRDHYTVLGDHPVTGDPGIFERALRHILPRLGMQNGNPLVYDSTLANEHASCPVYTPGN